MIQIGLDQYLNAKTHVSGYGFYSPGDQKQYQDLVILMEAEKIADPETPHATVYFTAAYWRKANQIHRWFVQNVQQGNDDCGTYYVGREQLMTLRNLCQKVLDSTRLVPGQVHAGTQFTQEGMEEMYEEGEVLDVPEIAKKLLPTQGGFFFGSTDYDQWYWQELEDTVKQLDRALQAPDGWFFEYTASW